MDYSEYVNTVEWFFGYGGNHLGIKRVFPNLRLIAACEIECYPLANIISKMEAGRLDSCPIWTDYKTFPTEPFKGGTVDLFIASYPCQPFSSAGQRKGAEDPRHLWPYVREFIRETKPKMCFFENVEGHISLGLREVLTDLVKLGYRVENNCGEPTWGLFSAAEVGAPHQRKRVFILADSRSPELNRLPEPEERRENRTVGESGFELAKSRLLRPEKQKQQAAGVKQQSEELVNAERKGPQGAGYPGETRKTISSTTNYQWPARPGQPQYEWEAPRVLADTKQPRTSGYCKNSTLPKNGEFTVQPRGIQTPKTINDDGNGFGRRKEPNSETKPQMGRTVNGSGSRVDELRLLGNGVVPATAEKAFRVLYGRITNPDKNYIQPSVQLEMFS